MYCDPNVGVAFVAARLECPCKELRQKLESDGRLGPVENDPRKGSIASRTAVVSFHVGTCYLVDVAGLVPGEIEEEVEEMLSLPFSNCDALIQVVDTCFYRY